MSRRARPGERVSDTPRTRIVAAVAPCAAARAGVAGEFRAIGRRRPWSTARSAAAAPLPLPRALGRRVRAPPLAAPVRLALSVALPLRLGPALAGWRAAPALGRRLGLARPVFAAALRRRAVPLAEGLPSLLGAVVFILRNAQNGVTLNQRGLVDLPRRWAGRARRRGPTLRWRAWKPGMPAADFSAQSRRDMLSYSKPRCDLRPPRGAFSATCADALRADASRSGGTSVPLSNSACAPEPRRRPSALSWPRQSRTWRNWRLRVCGARPSPALWHASNARCQ